MSIIQANELKFKTFDYLKVNETTVEIPAIFTQDFNLPSDKFVKIDEFKDDEYGVSKEALEINEEFGINIGVEDVNEDNFETVDSILKLVEDKLEY